MKTRKGVSVFFPKGNANWSEVTGLVKALPDCWVRTDALLWEVSYAPEQLSDTSRLDRLVTLVADSGHGLVLNIVPAPHPSVEAWQRVVGGRWPDWMRPPWRLWSPIRRTVQPLVDHVVGRWRAEKRSINDLRFAWWNEPARGHVGGPRVEGLRKGEWGEDFHRASTAMLVADGGLNFRGAMLCGPTLSFFGEKDAESVELASALGGRNGGWWERIDRRAFNSGIYLGRGTSLASAVSTYRKETQRRVDLMRALKVPAPPGPVDLHEWYASPGSIGRQEKGVADPERGEWIASLATALDKVEGLDLRIFFALNPQVGPEALGTLSAWERYWTSGTPALKGLHRWLAK